MKGPLIILSGPSGCGKSVVIRRLLAAGDLPLALSVSATTRRPRPDEEDGVDYFFWTVEHFEEEVRAGAFLEYAQVHGRDFYGTLRREVDNHRLQGRGVLLDIDVQGAVQVRASCPEAVSIFLLPPSLEVLEQRLRDRGTEIETAVQRRLETAREELRHVGDYAHAVVNDDLDRAVAEVRAIVRQALEKGENHAG